MHYIYYPYLAYPNYHPRQVVPTRFNESLQSQTALMPQNPFPPINTKLLNSSAQRFQELMKQANLLVEKIG